MGAKDNTSEGANDGENIDASEIRSSNRIPSTLKWDNVLNHRGWVLECDEDIDSEETRWSTMWKERREKNMKREDGWGFWVLSKREDEPQRANKQKITIRSILCITDLIGVHNFLFQN